MKPEITQEMIELYDEYTHAPLERRDFLSRLGILAGGSAIAVSMMPFLQNNYAQAAVVDPHDKNIETSMQSYPLMSKSVSYYEAKPKGAGPFSAVLVIHENRGLNPHIKDITRRLAKEGFLAIAIDALSLDGGTPSDEDVARDMINKLEAKDVMSIYTSSIEHIKNLPACNGQIGTVGFCWGGGWVNALAANNANVKASVAYYGMQTKTEDTLKISAPLLLHYAGLDKRIGAGISEFVKDLAANDKEFSVHNYAGVNHAFNNDTNGARYDKKAATLSWSRTVDFLSENL